VAVAARSQSLYRVLQGVLDERKPDLIEMIFLEVKDYVHDLMEDQFGNHVIQKLFEVCSEAQMTQLILSLIHNQRRLLGLCFHPVGYVHGVFVLIQTPNQ
jgi:anthranilate/para-aminobenzoate synthase component II